MFWKLGFHHKSAVETLLEKHDTTLEQLLDEEEILQESKAHNEKLIDFLSNTKNIAALIHYIIDEPENPEDEKTGLKYPFLSCEILCCELGSMYDVIMSDESLLSLLFGFLDHPAPLNSILSNYWIRFVAALQQTHFKEMLKYVQGRGTDLVHKLVKHIGTSSMNELVLKFMGWDLDIEEDDVQSPMASFARLKFEKTGPTEKLEAATVAQWWADQGIVDLLFDQFKPELDSEVHANSASILCNIVKKFALTCPQLADQIQSAASVQKIVDLVKENPGSTILTEGLFLLSILVEHNWSQTYNESAGLADMPPIYQTLVARIPDFANFLLNPPPAAPVVLTIGTLDPPLGLARLRITEFLVTLFNSKYAYIDAELIKNNVLGICMDLFFKYDLNNMLHNNVERMVHAVIFGTNIPFKEHLVKALNVPTLLMNAHMDNQEKAGPKANPKVPSKGNIAHIVRIANKLAGDESPTTRETLDGVEGWKEYAATVLQEVNRVEAQLLGGPTPIATSRVESDSDSDPFEQAESVPSFHDIEPSSDEFGFGDSNFHSDKAFSSEDMDIGPSFDFTATSRTPISLSLEGGQQDPAPMNSTFGNSKSLSFESSDFEADFDTVNFDSSPHSGETSGNATATTQQRGPLSPTVFPPPSNMSVPTFSATFEPSFTFESDGDNWADFSSFANAFVPAIPTTATDAPKDVPAPQAAPSENTAASSNLQDAFMSDDFGK